MVSNIMNEYIFTVVIGIMFYIIDKIKFPCTHEKIDIRHEIIHVLHNILGVGLFFGPFIINDVFVLSMMLFALGFIMIQGITTENKKQQCFLMPIYNKYCGIDENRNLFDLYSLAGVDKNTGVYMYSYYIIHLLVFSYTLLKIQRLKGFTLP
jgi:hypothetical protein